MKTPRKRPSTFVSSQETKKNEGDGLEGGKTKTKAAEEVQTSSEEKDKSEENVKSEKETAKDMIALLMVLDQWCQ